MRTPRGGGTPPRHRRRRKSERTCNTGSGTGSAPRLRGPPHSYVRSFSGVGWSGRKSLVAKKVPSGNINAIKAKITMGTYASSAIYIAWKKGQAIKPFAAFASRRFSPEKRSRIRPMNPGLLPSNSNRSLGAHNRLYRRISFVRSDGHRATLAAGTARSSEMASARPRHRPAVRPEGVGPPPRRERRQAPPIHLSRISLAADDEGPIPIPLRHGMDDVRQRVGRGDDQGTRGARPSPIECRVRDVPMRRRLHDFPSVERPVRFRRPPRPPVGRQALTDRTRGAGATPRAEALCLQERKVGPRCHVHGRGGARILGDPRV